MLTRLLTQLHVFLPLLALSRLAGHVARWRGPGGLLIRVFAGIYSIDTTEAAKSVPQGYRDLSEFFSRELKPGARRPEGGSEVAVSPADGVLTQLGSAREISLPRAKGGGYSLEQLLGGARCAQPYQQGHMAVVYLRPSDYHRVHMPMSGQLREIVYLPGRRLPVNPALVRAMPSVLAANERVALHFDAGAGQFCVVLVGALNVGSISTAFEIETHANIPPVRSRWRFPGPLGAKRERGDYLGHFNLGSTVVLATTEKLLHWLPGRREGEILRCGQPLGELRTAPM